MTTREAQKLKAMSVQLAKALSAIKQQRQEIEMQKSMLEGCERQRHFLEKRVESLMADLVAITRMDGRE